MSLPAIAIHGGTGTIPQSDKTPEVEKQYKNALQQTLDSGFDLLKKDDSALEAATQAICSLEDCELFNAGKGSVFTAKGEHEMDASIMEGSGLKAGAVAGIQGIKNPVLLAKSVLENSEYVLLAGDEALEFARRQGYEFMADSYFFTQKRYDQWMKVKGSSEVKLDHSDGKNLGTVGAVAVDTEGNVAAATSTGGMTNKAWGRIGDSPIIGAGTYANNATCAVSCTGHGEYFMRGVAAYDVSSLMEYKGKSLEQAADEVINHRVKNMGGEGGLIAVDALGNIALPFNCEAMYRGIKNKDSSFTAIY